MEQDLFVGVSRYSLKKKILKSFRGNFRFLFSYAFLLVFLFSGVAMADAQAPSHDPTKIAFDGGRYWSYTTGNGIWNMSASNSDFTDWQGEDPVFPLGTWPSWINDYVPGFSGDFWAPGIFYMNNQWYMYYSCSSFGSNESAIGVATSPSLSNPSWQDQGMVISSSASDDYNAIDPAIFWGDDKLWMVFGSFWQGIVITELDPATGKPYNRNNLTSVATSNNLDNEAPYVIPHGDYYYLFFNVGKCCNGANSTYDVLVGRSTSPTGPFYDKDGVDCRNGGGTLFLDESGRYIGPGCVGYGEGKLTYHYYDGYEGGSAKLMTASLYWENGWPVSDSPNFVETGGGDVNTFSLSTNTYGEGSISFDPSGGTYEEGTVVTVTANASSGWDFDTWSGDLTGSANPQTITMNSNQSITANFVEINSGGGGVVSEGTFNIINRNSGLYLSVESTGTNNGANVFQWSSSSDQAQEWELTDEGDGYYRISPTHASGMALDVNGVSQNDGANVQIWEYLSGGNQQWAFTDMGDGYYTISARHSGKFLEVTYAETDNGANVQQYSNTDHHCQQWALSATDGGNDYTTYSLNTNTYGEGSISLNPSGGTYEEGTVVTITANASSDWEFDAWSGDLVGSANPQTITMNSDQSIAANFTEINVGGISEGIYSIINRNSNQYLSVQSSGNYNGANVVQWSSGNQHAQEFELIDVGDGYYQISPTHTSGMALDVSGVSQNDGANVHIWEYLSSGNQQWTFTDVGDGYYTITARHSGKLLEVGNANTWDGANVQQYSNTGHYCQHWFLNPLKSASANNTGIDENLSGEIKIYPNPSSDGNFNIQLGDCSEAEKIEIRITDLQGRMVYNQSIASAQNRVFIQSNLGEGLYILNLYCGDEIFYQKLRVE